MGQNIWWGPWLHRPLPAARDLMRRKRRKKSKLVDVPCICASDKHVISRHFLVGRNFFEANARVVSPVIERVSYRRHLINSCSNTIYS